MKVSIVTVCKNADKHIEKAIQSVISQRYPDIEYIIVDGQSSDRTVEIIRQYADRIDKVVSEPDDGIYQAMNKGIQLATGDFISFLNSDDYLVDDGVIADVVDFIAQHSPCDFVYGDMEMRSPHGKAAVHKPKPPEDLLSALIYLDGPQHPASFFRRELFSALGLFKESYKIAADYEWFLRLAQDGTRAIHYFPRVITSFSTGGLSNSQQRTALTEVFDSQNHLPIYNTPEWLNTRLERFQDIIIDLHEKLWHRNQQIQAQAQAQAAIAPMVVAKGGVVMAKSAELRRRLSGLVGPQPTHQAIPQIKPLYEADVVITPNEVNLRHGTGILVKRLFETSSNILSIRSINSYGADHDFGDASVCLSYTGMSRPEIYSTLLRVLNGSTIKRILCVAYLPDDVRTAIALKDLFNVPLCVYLMDDNNVHSDLISNDLMRELLNKADLRLAISPELRDAYQMKYNHKVWLLPPVVQKRYIQSDYQPVSEQALAAKTGVLIGNVWSKTWLEKLRQTLRGSGLQIDWYGKVEPDPAMRRSLEVDGLHLKGFIPDDKFYPLLRQYAYMIMPTGTLDAEDDLQVIARLSLPSRLALNLATCNLPTVVLGSRDTGAAHFVERFRIGTVCDYNTQQFQDAVTQICDPATQRQIRQTCAAIAETFASDDIASWIWKSLELGEPSDLRFETLIPALPNSLYPFIEPPVPQGLWGDFIDLYQVMRRLKHQGFNPDFVIDIGASTGIWSHTVHRLFPQSRYLLIEPLASKYDQAAQTYYLSRLNRAELIEAAVSHESSRASFQVSPDLAGSSLLHPKDFRSYETVEVEVKTLDQVAREKALYGRGFLKIDVQCAEHLVLAGAKELLNQVDVISVELSLPRYDESAKTYLEMFNIIDQLGFRYYDDVGSWRSPVDGTLLQKDIVFVRKGLFEPLISS